MQATPQGERLHIALFGRRNAGKSSLINALTNQDTALVSNVPGTTTDPVYKNMELLPIGPVVMIDTAGIDDVGMLGEMRVQRSMKVMNKTDVGLLVFDLEVGLGEYERDLLKNMRQREIPVVGVINKIDMYNDAESKRKEWERELGLPIVLTSAMTREGIDDLKQAIIKNTSHDWLKTVIIGDLIDPGDAVVLVIPIDTGAPKGRLILPQVQTIRDIIDHDGYAIMVKERELKEALQNLNKKPRMVVTDSQAFMKVGADTPLDIPLTSFSILFARYKGDLVTMVEGAKAISKLKPGSKVLIAEACTHHQQADDLGRVQIPRWIRQLVGGEVDFEWVHGGDFPQDLPKYQLIIHCGACMINRKEMIYRVNRAKEEGVPIVNYGVLLAYIHGILDRALEPFPLAKLVWEEEE